MEKRQAAAWPALRHTPLSRGEIFGEVTHKRKAVTINFRNVLIHIQQNATLHSLFYLQTVLHVLGSTTTHHQERKQLYLQHLVFVRQLLLPAAIAAGSSNSVMMGGGTTRNM